MPGKVFQDSLVIRWRKASPQSAGVNRSQEDGRNPSPLSTSATPAGEMGVRRGTHGKTPGGAGQGTEALGWPEENMAVR